MCPMDDHSPYGPNEQSSFEAQAAGEWDGTHRVQSNKMFSSIHLRHAVHEIDGIQEMDQDENLAKSHWKGLSSHYKNGKQWRVCSHGEAGWVVKAGSNNPPLCLRSHMQSQVGDNDFLPSPSKETVQQQIQWRGDFFQVNTKFRTIYLENAGSQSCPLRSHLLPATCGLSPASCLHPSLCTGRWAMAGVGLAEPQGSCRVRSPHIPEQEA